MALSLSAAPTTARKCMLPKRTCIPGTDAYQSDVCPSETPKGKAYEHALRGFFYDLCVPRTNQKLSRGYLSGLEVLAYHLGPKSDLVKTCQAVAFACHGMRLNRPRMKDTAERLHQELLGSLAKAIEVPDSATSRETNTSNFDPELQTIGAFSVPALREGEESLDGLMFELEILLSKSAALPKPLNSLLESRGEVLALHRRFSHWVDSRCPEIRPITVAHIKQTGSESDMVVGCRPGRVDTYFDLYVAGIWDIVRTAQLLIVDMVVRLSGSLHQDGPLDCTGAANAVLEDVVASIPYHLTDDLHAFLYHSETDKWINDPGRVLGGLLLMHPLYTLSQLSIVSEEMSM
ncbi:hypothetical protein FZEAL_10305 [Fusarium zealandicum]|uniref:Uncharacterized protein n=1 Tax=Fusarium zealandicum TaxID=1053134 RepID=A0A8H4U3Y6_9HYPO|nr:hypothetical protein FZEAL_10305 [Fusarium zealandicum]